MNETHGSTGDRKAGRQTMLCTDCRRTVDDCSCHDDRPRKAPLVARPRVSIASDYAVLHCTNGDEYYYGYEVMVGPEDDPEWCFEFRDSDGERTAIRFSRLGQEDQFDVVTNLLAGIAIWLSGYNGTTNKGVESSRGSKSTEHPQYKK